MASAKKSRPDPVRTSVVKLFAVTKRPSYFQPWDFEYQQTSGGGKSYEILKVKWA